MTTPLEQLLTLEAPAALDIVEARLWFGVEAMNGAC